MANFNKYDVPFYGVAWHRSCVVLAGGGGECRSGIPNAVLLTHFDFASNTLSDQTVAKLRTGSDLPYRMALHPNADGFVCAFPKHCKWFEWVEEHSSEDDRKLGVKQSEKELTPLEDVDQQLALAFNNDGSILASGSEDGNLKVFKWPSMEIILDEAKAHTSVKDLDFSPDGKFLISLGGSDCRVWDVISSKAVASLPTGNDEMFCWCRFSQVNDKKTVLYTAAVTGKGGSIVTWNTTTWTKISSKTIVRDTISAFDVSADGKFLACGTTQGDVWIVNSTTMRIHQVVKKAHLLVTALRFSRDSRALASASMDSSARVTIIKEAKKDRVFNLWLIILIIVIAIATYFWKNSESLEQFLESLKRFAESK